MFPQVLVMRGFHSLAHLIPSNRNPAHAPNNNAGNAAIVAGIAHNTFHFCWTGKQNDIPKKNSPSHIIAIICIIFIVVVSR